MGKRKKIAFVSLNTGGTNGHNRLLRQTIDALIKKHDLYIIADTPQGINLPQIHEILVPKQNHTKTVGGCFEYMHYGTILSHIKKENISTLIFSTFFDPRIVEESKLLGVHSVYMSYPLRDSHKMAVDVRKERTKFDTVIWLSDIITNPNTAGDNNVSPLIDKKTSQQTSLSEKKILISCGGGGRPSGDLFYKLIEGVISDKTLSDYHFTIIDRNKKFRKRAKNSTVISWSDNFLQLMNEHLFLISEAGYHTVSELVELEKPAVLVPGARRIDNQELRAVQFEKLGCGKFCFPEEGVSRLVQTVHDVINSLDSFSFTKAHKMLYSKKSLDVVLNEVIQ